MATDADRIRIDLAHLRHTLEDMDEHPYRVPCGEADAIADRIAALELDLAQLPDATDPARFDRLDDGTLVACYSHAGRTVAAIVHPRRILHPMDPVPPIAWALAGDLMDATARPTGAAPTTRTACAEAVAALGQELRLPIDSWTVET